MSITALRKSDKKLALIFLGVTFFLGITFLVNKYFEWGEHIKEHIYPGSQVLSLRGQGDTLFYGLYFFMTGLHALHIIIGLIFMGFVTFFILKNRLRSDKYVLLENCGLYWHLVDIIWIFLFPLFYLIT
jgi:cytochrome c oxidase subunit 3